MAARAVVGAGPPQPLRAAVEQSPSWAGSNNGQEWLKDASMRTLTHHKEKEANLEALFV